MVIKLSSDKNKLKVTVGNKIVSVITADEEQINKTMTGFKKAFEALGEVDA